MFTSPRRVRFKEQEYAIPREHLAEALTAIRGLFARHDWRISFPIEVRVAPGDEVWLSTAYGRSTAYIAIHVFHTAPHKEYFREVEAVMTGLGGVRTGASCTPATRNTFVAAIPGSRISSRCGTNSTRPAGSAIPTWNRSWARRPA